MRISIIRTNLLINPSLLKSLGKNAMAKSRAYSWDRLADVFIKEYQNILEGGK